MRSYLLALLLPLPALAQSYPGQIHTGAITQVRIDSSTSAALCVATAPELRGAAWLCLYTNRPHYHEMKEMLFRAFEKRTACSFEWAQIDSLTNRARIDALSCYT